MLAPKIRGLLFAGFALIGCQNSGWRKPENEPFRLAFWYWSSPLQFRPDEVDRLVALKTDRILVRAFTVSYDGDKVVPILGQRFMASKGAPPIILVANLDAGMVRHFREADPEDLRRSVVAEFSARQKLAEQAGYRVIGWQLDFDVPTSQLAKYAGLLKALRPDCKGELSISGLQTWMTSAALAPVLEPLDAWYPQFYEGDLPNSPDDRQSLSNLSEKATRMRDYGKPFWIGIATYGSTLAFDPMGKRMGVVRGISLIEAKNRYGKADEWTLESGEVGARVPVSYGPRAGWTLRYSVPTLASLQRDISVARETGAMGAALFRYPANGDPTAMALPTVSAAWKGEPGRVEIHVTKLAERQPIFDYIERPAADKDHAKVGSVRLSLVVKNTGNVASGEVTLNVEGARVADILNGGDFHATPVRGRYSTAGIPAGESMKFGPIITSGDRSPRVRVSYVSAPGKPETVVVN